MRTSTSMGRSEGVNLLVEHHGRGCSITYGHRLAPQAYEVPIDIMG